MAARVWRAGRLKRIVGCSVVTLTALTFAGCVARPKAEPASQPADPAMAMPEPAASQPSFIFQEITPGEATGSEDHLRVLIEVIRIGAPVGSISGSQTFWQMTSQQLLPPGRQEFFAANGMRFATLEATAWSAMKEEVERHAGVVSQTSMARGNGRVDIAVRTTPSQTLFLFDQEGRLRGRSFENSDNLWGLRFAPDPAQRGQVALSLCPVVRATRRQMQVTRRSNDYEVEYVQPEALYELGMDLRLPLGTALVMAPTPSVVSETNSLGRAFLTVDDPAGLMEYVFILYPRMYRLNAKATQEQFEVALQRELQQQQQLEQPADQPASGRAPR